MGEAVNYSALQNSSKVTASKANNQACVQTQSLSSPIRDLFWTDKNGAILQGYAPYGDTITLNVSTQIPGIDLYISIYKQYRNGFIEIRKEKFVSDPTNKTYRVNVDTLSSPVIYGDTTISCRITYYGSPPLFSSNDLKRNDVDAANVSLDIVPYIPIIMRAKGWTVAEKALNQWFSNTYNTSKTETDLAVTTIIKMKWARSFSYIDKTIKGKFNEGFFSSKESIGEIISTFKDQVKDSKLQLPVNVGDQVLFGINNPTSDKGETVPLFYKYHFQSIQADIPTFKYVDEFIAAVNECNIEFIAFGKIRKVMPTLFEATVEKIGIYILDSFDVKDSKGITGWIKESVVGLGYWDVKGNNVGWFPRGGAEFTHVTNEMFRKWRDRNQKGQDYTSYSDIEMVDFNLKFKFDDKFQLVT